jgi:hypothetical protein
MRIPKDATIDETKFTGYLLVQRPWDDKSDYLRRAGFELENWHDLRAAIRRLADAVDAVEDGSNEYGTFYRKEPQCLFNCMIVSRFARPSPSTRFEPVMWRRWSTLSTTLHRVLEDVCWNASMHLVSR